jgi:LPXTG-motif cell wall-anchored protein
VNIAAPANDFASASTFTGSPTSSTSVVSASKTFGTKTSGSGTTPAPTHSTATQSQDGGGQGPKPRSGFSTAAIAGVIVGLLALLALLGSGALLLWRRRRQSADAERVVPLEQYVRPYEARLAPARPFSEKRAPSTLENAGFPAAGSSSGARTELNAEFEERFEERFQTRLMHFLQTQMDPPGAPGAPSETLPSYPGTQAEPSHAPRRVAGDSDVVKTSIGS